MNSSWNGRCMVNFQQGNMKHKMDSLELRILSWKTTTLICFTMKNRPTFDDPTSVMALLF
jgi:hypothetical protein